MGGTDASLFALKFSRYTHVDIKAISLYTPSEKDISKLLKEFTVEFLLNGTLNCSSTKLYCLIIVNVFGITGYNTLVDRLHQQLLQQGHNMPLDKSHFFGSSPTFCHLLLYWN